MDWNYKTEVSVDQLTGPSLGGNNDENLFLSTATDAGVDMAERGLLGGYGVPQHCRATDNPESK